MVVEDVRDFVFSKLFFPKVAVIDKPGIIISKTSSKYGGRESKRRNDEEEWNEKKTKLRI